MHPAAIIATALVSLGIVVLTILLKRREDRGRW